MPEKRLITRKPFQPGQVWELRDSTVHIQLVGRFLVHYRHFKTNQPRVPVSLTSKVKLGKFLTENGATLVPGSSDLSLRPKQAGEAGGP